ncbi:MAG: iron-sulfur cluster assembly accessory protein [Candidatus Eisenbacteria bacterium]|uniref:Iron-sulfur cluster assembly accessory protein n=1 Tax=Eiseniibacteriota bacterium TaxID=2212470 RepID=A0A9D6L5E2_UNCEI|nr:iron-sulfur cluster assembly accessory protein [Candidatus Eisenbacteria bacterium]MBI3540162.1 iron-sulfur cluster assembly accessory protein [Candidatus Eisenbacteria bacterium]
MTVTVNTVGGTGTPAPTITLTPVAATKVRELLAGRGTPGTGLRVGVRGGGCSGNSYFMEFCDAESPGDLVIDSNDVRLVVDARSAMLLGGTEVDYVEGLMGTGFKFNNPNVRHACACGESFSV